jgi:hypothetical protein
MGKRGEQRPPGQQAAGKDPPPHGNGGGRKPFPVHEHVGRRLKEMFEEVTTQPIPDKFVKLLEDLQQRQAGEPPADPTGTTPPTSKRKPRKSK